MRSTIRKLVYARGLNAVVPALPVQPPWGGKPLALPISCRLHRKGAARTYGELAEDMLRGVVRWLPEKYRCKLVCDGAYSALAEADLPRCPLTSLMPPCCPAFGARHGWPPAPYPPLQTRRRAARTAG